MPSALNAPSTVVYVPRPTPSGILCSLPVSFLDTRYDPGGVPLTFTEVSLNSGATATDLQNAIDAAAARSGHTRITLATGFDVSASWLRLKPHMLGTFWTYIEWASLASASAEGVRCIPANMGSAPKLGLLSCEPGANNYRFSGLRGVKSGSADIIWFFQSTDGDFNPVVNSMNDVPQWIIVDRCWLNGNNTTGAVRNGVVLNTREGAVVDSVIDAIWEVGTESHAIVGYATRGPLKIVNNTLESAGISILLGGADPYYTGLVATDVEIRRNYVTRRDSWNPYHGSYDSIVRNPIKNDIELKDGVRVLIEGNVLENSWEGAQGGALFGIRNMAGESSTPGLEYFITKDVTFRYNLLRQCFSLGYVLGRNYSYESIGGTSRVAIYHNLGYDIADDLQRDAGTSQGATGMQLTPSDIPTADVAIEHNTFFAALDQPSRLKRLFMFASAGPSDLVRLRFRDNLSVTGWYPDDTDPDRFPVTFQGDGSQSIPPPSEGEVVSDTHAPGASIVGNVIVGANAAHFPGGGVLAPSSVAAVQMVDPTNKNFRLQGGSPYKNGASDGTDPGANQDDIELATLGVATGTVGPAVAITITSSVTASANADKVGRVDI